MAECHLAVGDITPGCRRVATFPGASSVAHDECPPQARGNAPGHHGGFQGRAVGCGQDPAERAVRHQWPQFLDRHGLTRSELCGSEVVGELIGVYDDDDLRTGSVLRRGFVAAKRRGAELFESVGGALFR